MRVRNEAMRMNTVTGVDVPVQKYEVVYRMIREVQSRVICEISQNAESLENFKN